MLAVTTCSGARTYTSASMRNDVAPPGCRRDCAVSEGIFEEGI